MFQSDITPQNKKVDKTENLVDYHGEFGGLSRRIWWIITENLVDYDS
jgi:hypothetical protein